MNLVGSGRVDLSAIKFPVVQSTRLLSVKRKYLARRECIALKVYDYNEFRVC